jgi:hypothetical protein
MEYIGQPEWLLKKHPQKPKTTVRNKRFSIDSACTKFNKSCVSSRIKGKEYEFV